ncbi:MAG: HAD family hydrolase [Chloroflexi bacterium]|nr:HAD family hydrolase [Chloroflexota bacterium]
MAITTILLDAGGVILDESEFELVKAEIISRNLASLVAGYCVDDYFRDIEEAVKSFCPDAERFVVWKHSGGDVALFERLYGAFISEWRQRAPAMRLSDGLADEVRAISKGYAIGIAGQYRRPILDLLERESILQCFAHRYTQDDFSITKPDPRYYAQIASACGVEPEECVMVGDRIDKDIIPARMLGMKTVLIRVGLHRNQQPRIPAEIPDIELPSVVGLARAIEDMGRSFYAV